MDSGVKHAGNTVQPRENIATVATEIERELERLADVVSNFRGIADALEGGRPRDASAEKEAPPPVSVLDRVTRLRRRLAMLNSECEGEMNRINAALGR